MREIDPPFWREKKPIFRYNFGMGTSQTTSGLENTSGPARSRSYKSFAQRMDAITDRFVPWLVHHRRPVLAGLVTTMLAMEGIEHLWIVPTGSMVHRLYDSLRFALLVPAGVWIALMLLERSETRRELAAYHQDLQTELSQEMGEARTWEDLTHAVVTFFQRIAPSAGVVLYVLHPSTLHLEPAQGVSQPAENTHLQAAAGEKFQPGTPLLTCDLSAQPANGPTHYDLPFQRDKETIGLVQLTFPAGRVPTASEARLCRSAAPVIALALESALREKMAAEQAAASDAGRQEIARNLHDTLAQNISYLRLKLDQLTGENAVKEISVVLSELERMRSSADEAYQQVRSTLDDLHPMAAEDLAKTIHKQARAISARAGFLLHYTQTGVSFPLPAPLRQQVLYIAREALHNVEKHAQASNVHLQLLWLDSGLILKITDDGVGFHPVPTEDGHYGLWIMRQRAQDSGGRLAIGNGEEQGTEVTLWVPRPVSAGLQQTGEQVRSD
jgi:signal transduction histidine kinase